MRLKPKLWLYIGLLHFLIVALLIQQRDALGGWLIVAEVSLVVTLLIGTRLIRSVLQPVAAALAVRDRVLAHDFASRCAPVGDKQIDSILESYNEMLASLQREWLRLGEQRGFLDRFLQVTPVGVVLFDFDRRISLVNQRAHELLDLQSDLDPLGQELSALDAPLASWLMSLPINEPRMTTDVAGRRLLCRRAEFQDRGFSRTYLLIEELTAELNRRERESYERFIRVVAHEVTNSVAATNSLLQSCLHYADQIQRGEDRDDYVNAIGVLIRRNQNLREFTDRFSELVKLPEPNRQQVDIGELLHEIQTMFKAELESRQIAMELCIDPDLPQVSLDRNQMDRVLINVLKNAIEAVDSRGHIELVAAHDAGCVQVSIIDNGVGLSGESRENLFVPFYTTKKHGQGLGLTLVKEILVQHGFAFSLDSRDGKTRFRFRMPGVLIAPS